MIKLKFTGVNQHTKYTLSRHRSKNDGHSAEGRVRQLTRGQLTQSSSYFTNIGFGSQSLFRDFALKNSIFTRFQAQIGPPSHPGTFIFHYSSCCCQCQVCQFQVCCQWRQGPAGGRCVAVLVILHAPREAWQRIAARPAREAPCQQQLLTLAAAAPLPASCGVTPHYSSMTSICFCLFFRFSQCCSVYSPRWQGATPM